MSDLISPGLSGSAEPHQHEFRSLHLRTPLLHSPQVGQNGVGPSFDHVRRRCGDIVAALQEQNWKFAVLINSVFNCNVSSIESGLFLTLQPEVSQRHWQNVQIFVGAEVQLFEIFQLINGSGQRYQLAILHN